MKVMNLSNGRALTSTHDWIQSIVSSISGDSNGLPSCDYWLGGPDSPYPFRSIVQEFKDAEPGRFMDALLCSSIASKADFLALGIDRKAVAIASFVESEQSCQRVNDAITSGSSPLFVGSWNSPQPLWLLRRKIQSVLSDDFNWNEWVSLTGFGPGATVGIPRRKASPAYKFGCSAPTSTVGCATLGRTTMKWFDLWDRHLKQLGGDLEIVQGNRIVTVPKNAKTDRVIAVEPLVNGFCQRGVGRMIRKRLKRVGVNLTDQTHNQFLAGLGSLRGSLATLDLSRASDSLPARVVEQLLPSDWFSAMNCMRSPAGVLPSGDSVCYQKFSSMGNGFTFELESLIFWAVLSVVKDLIGGRDDIISVYGDDLICPSHYTELVTEYLRWLGFSLNREKSYWGSDVLYRESCGKHYFHGVDVTPFYVRHSVEESHRRIWLANEISRWAYRRNATDWGRDIRLQPVWASIVGSLPTKLRSLRIPEGYGDGGLVSDFDECLPCPRLHAGKWEGWVVEHYAPRFRTRPQQGEGRLIASLFEILTGDTDDDMRDWRKAAENLSCRHVLRKLHVRQWRDLGPWQ